MDEVEVTVEPFAYCVWCNCPLRVGDLCRYYGKNAQGIDEWAHRMSTWCDEYRRSVKRGDEALMQEMGISLPDEAK